MATIIDPSAPGCGNQVNPCIAAVFGPTKTYDYWSSTTYDGTPYWAWMGDFIFARSVYDSKGKDIYVRAVRGGS